jgi:hypothetical protein
MTHMQLYYFNLWYVCPRILEALSLLFKFIPEFARYEKYCWFFFRYTRGRVFSNISFHISIVANIYIYLCSYFFHCKTVLDRDCLTHWATRAPGGTQEAMFNAYHVLWTRLILSVWFITSSCSWCYQLPCSK